MESFHDFYEMVEAKYQNRLTDIDTKDEVNPLIDCELGTIIIDKAVVKVENDGQLDSYVLDNVNADDLFSSHFDDSKGGSDSSYSDQTISLAVNLTDNANAILTTNRMHGSARKCTQSDTRNTQTSHDKHKNTAEIIAPATDSIPKQHIIPKATVNGFT